MYSYVIRMSLVCNRMSSVCHTHVLVCHPYVTRMYSYVIHMPLVCGFTMNPCHANYGNIIHVNRISSFDENLWNCQFHVTKFEFY